MAAFLLGAFFSLCGLVSLRWGKKSSDARAMVVGTLLIVYPYFVSSAIVMTVIGAGLVAALFVRR